mgnify:CR=1 FL=1
MEKTGSLPGNITVVLKDTGPTPAGATQAASQAVQEGASVILGPLRAEQVTAAGAVARAAGLHTSRIDGAELVYNQPDPTLPDLIVCRPEAAASILEVTAPGE